MATLSQRGEIRLGFRCNARCGFCYYQDLLDNPPEKEPSTNLVIRQLEQLRRAGATEVEFTGGEPTIKRDLVFLIQHAKKLGFVNVSLITNGLRLAKKSYAERLVAAGLNDILFSIHGHNATVHDAHTAIPGSFSKIVHAVTVMRELGVRIRISSTVTRENHKHLNEMMQLFLDLGTECVHLAVFSPVAQATGTAETFFISYEVAAVSIKGMIEGFKSRLPKLSVKYIPFCFMVGYEKYVMNYYQQNYDPDDWNYYYSNIIRRAYTRPRALLFDLMSLFGSAMLKNFSTAWKHGFFGLKVFGFTKIVELLRKKRVPACRKCRYDWVCDHIWKEYIIQHGSESIYSVPGEKILDPAWSYMMADYRKPGEPLQRSGPPNHTATRRIEILNVS